MPADDRSVQTRRAILAAGAAGAGGVGLGLLSASSAGAQETRDDRYVWRDHVPVNVQDHGAPAGGTTDDSDAIQAAIDVAVAAGGGTVYFPPGDYIVNKGVSVPADTPVRLVGAGMAMKSGAAPSTRLKRTSTTGPFATMITVSGSSFSTRGWVSIEHMGIYGGGQAGRGIDLQRCQNVYLHRLRVSGCTTNAIRCTQLFNATGDNIYIASSGNGTTDPAWLFDALAESHGACDTCLFTNVQFEGNAGTDLQLDGNTTFSTAANNIQFANVKMEAGSGAYPFIKLGYTQHVYFTNLHISNASRTVTPVQEADPSSGTRSNKLTNVTVDFTGGTAPYAIDLTRRAVEIANLNVIYGSDPNGPNGAMTAAVHIGSNMGTGRVRLANVVTSGTARLVQDERSTPASVASAATVTLPPGEALVRVTGTTGITGITAEEQGRVATLLFTASLTVTNSSALKLAGAANFAATANDTLTLVCDGANWIETARSLN